MNRYFDLCSPGWRMYLFYDFGVTIVLFNYT